MDKFYGGGGVDGHAKGDAAVLVGASLRADALGRTPQQTRSRYQALPASNPYDSEPADYDRQLAAGFALKYGVALDAD